MLRAVLVDKQCDSLQAMRRKMWGQLPPAVQSSEARRPRQAPFDGRSAAQHSPRI